MCFQRENPHPPPTPSPTPLSIFFHIRKKREAAIDTSLFTDTKECERSGAQSISIFSFSRNYTTALKFILITIFIFYAPNQTCHMVQVGPHRLKKSHAGGKKKKPTSNRRHLVSAICITAAIQLTSMAPFIDARIQVLHWGRHRGCLGWQRRRALLFI